MSDDPVRLLVVLGSVTPPGRLHRALAATLEALPDGVEAELLDLATQRLPWAGAADTEQGDAGAVAEAVAGAGAVIFATPVYRGSITGALKNLFDLLPVRTLEGKPVGLVAMGASLHHFLGADRHLRDVLAFFGALPTPVSAYLTSADFADGEPSVAALAQLAELTDGVTALARALPALGPLGPRPLAAGKTA